MGFLDDVINTTLLSKVAPRTAVFQLLREDSVRNPDVHRRKDNLFQEITSDETISDRTRAELLQRLDAFDPGDDGAFASAKAEFEKAKEGIEPKFRARQKTEEFLKITRDKPGQRQTRFVDSFNNLGL